MRSIRDGMAAAAQDIER